MSSSTNVASASGNSNNSGANESSKIFSSDSMSVTDKNTTGFELAHDKLRTILVHPIGMLMTSILNNTTPPLMPEGYWSELLPNDSTIKDWLKDDTISTDFDYILAAAVLTWNGTSEQELTGKIHSYIDALSTHQQLKGFSDLNTENVNSVIFEKEKNAAGTDQHGGRVDFFVSKENSGIYSTASLPSSVSLKEPLKTPPKIPSTKSPKVPANKKTVVAIVEVGIHHHKWWSKTDQILEYVNSIRTRPTSPFIFDQPILLRSEERRVGKECRP